MKLSKTLSLFTKVNTVV